MKKVEALKDIIEFNSGFKTAVNLYLSLNKPEKVLGYIPTKSSVSFMSGYMSAVLNNKEQATLLVGPYGKGKSHLLLVLLAVLSMERTTENGEVIKSLVSKLEDVDEIGVEAAAQVDKIWAKKRFLPILITDTTGDLNQAFIYGLNEALKRDGLSDVAPDTYYSIAIEKLADWESNYVDTFLLFEKELSKTGNNIASLRTDLKICKREALEVFRRIYPKVTAGSDFNPMAVSDVLPLYKSVSERLVEDHEYSGLYIVFDEFSKFIESQDGTSSGSNMKLLQDICELATESHNAKVFFTMVAHKSIKEYGKYLSADIINSFTGIEGRIIEKLFVTSSKNNYELVKNAIVKDDELLTSLPCVQKYVGEQALHDYHQLPAFKSKFLEKDFDSIILKGCYPLNPIATYLLLSVSEKVAQNERTLFTFISNDEPNSMPRFVSENPIDWSIGVDLIYNYFEPLFKKEVSNEYIHNIWLSAQYVLERCTSEDQRRLVKALAIILIVNKDDELPGNDLCLKKCASFVAYEQAAEELVKGQYIYKKSSTGAYVFKTRAGVELKSEIRKQRELKGDNVNYSSVLAEVTGKYFIVPRKYNTLHYMTRYFVNQYMDVSDFLSIESANTLLSDCNADGKVITLFSFTGIKQEQVNKHLEELGDSRIVVVCPKRGIKAQKQLKDFEIIHDLRDNQSFNNDNEILKNELPLLLDELTTEIEEILDDIYKDVDTRVLYLAAGKAKNAKAGNEEIAVNECCENIYYKTAHINNEMVNRSVIGTAQTKKARVNIIQAILNHEDDEEFFKGSNQEATVYRSLFCQTGLKEANESQELNEIIQVINSYIDSCCDVKAPMTRLINKLTSAPYGLRLGVIPIYFAYVLASRREDIIVYFADKELQLTADIVVSMCEQADDFKVFVSKEDLQKEKYISELRTLFEVEENRNLSSNRIKDIFICMQRWFRALPQVSRNLICIDKYVDDERLISVMKSMKKALQRVEYNPFEILFVILPKEFGTDTLEETYEIIDQCKTLYDDYYDWVQNESVTVIYESWGGKKKTDLYHILFEWYEKQSQRSKQGLYSGRTTNFMSAIESLSVFNDTEIARKLAKAVTDVYMEDWNVTSMDDFAENLAQVKSEIESIKDESVSGELMLSFTGRDGQEHKKLYSHADESTGSVLRNIIEETLEEFDDLSVNDRVSILLEMIEKLI